MSISSSVCLFKSEKAGDAYRSTFESAGFEISFEPVLEFDFVNEELLEKELCGANSSSYIGLVATSPRSLEAIGRVLSKLDAQSRQSVQDTWKSRILFAVGDATVSASPIAFAQAVSVCSDASHLGESIIARLPACQGGSELRKLLFPCSNIRRDILPTMLSHPSLSIELHEIIAYTTKKIQCLDHLAENKPKWWAFFSPSGVSAVFDTVPPSSIANIKIAAIGNTTADSLQRLGLSVAAIAQKPSAIDLLNCIEASSTNLQ